MLRGAIFLLLGWITVCHPVLAQDAAAVPEVERVFVVVLENTDADQALAQPFLQQLARRGAYLGDMHAVARPSQPNYLALIGGSTFGVSSNENVDLDERHLGDLVEEKGKRWLSYTEDYPGDCYLGARLDDYTRKHQPFLSFKSVQNDPRRCANVVHADQLQRDLAAKRLPDLALYIPDARHSGHDTGVKFASTWLERTFGPLLDEPAFMEGTLFILTFDESGGSRDNRIYTALYGPMVAAGRTADARYDLYSLLRTIELALGLGDLGREDRSARPITGVWK